MQWLDSIDRNNDLWFITFVLVLLVFGLIRQSEGARLQIFLRSFVNTSLLTQQVRQERTYNRITIPIFFLVVLIVALFLIQTSRFLDLAWFDSFLPSLGSMLLLVLAFTIVRAVIYTFLAVVFDLWSVLRLYNLEWLQLNFVLSLVLLPISILISYGPEPLVSPLIYLGLTAMGLTYILRSVRLFIMAQTEVRAPMVYNVLYLCALEILPPILVVVSILRQGEG